MAHKFLGGKDYNPILHEKGFKYGKLSYKLSKEEKAKILGVSPSEL